ncbi:mannitol 2-dehydrogenase [Rhodococcus sp. 27YEA15]|uniref:mannitol dehydrogenase family protein n=1 Tax=Rhodococcus sp. 27YEA15 TaxID=3156259 RepID=UPI003C7E90BE
MKLSNSTLHSLPSDVVVPTYDRSDLTPGIVHIGVGHFHRSHQAMYLDRLLHTEAGAGWAIWGVSIESKGEDIADALAGQDGLYSLTEKDPDGATRTTVIGSIVGFDRAADDGEPVISRLADPNTKIISLTITEGGYGIDPVTGAFSGAGDPLIEADLADPNSNRSWLGLVVKALIRRKESGAGAVTLMSCDNIQENGHVAREALIGFTKAVAPELLSWIDANMSFPSSMVDRVTPGTVDADRAFLSETYGVDDAWPVTCEPFTQWVLEDNFAAGRPALETVGVDVVADVEPYELMKLRLANGTHQALCYFGHLLGLEYVHEAIADPGINAMLLRYIDEEAVPTLRPIPGVDLHGWGRTVLQRFGNPQIKDRLSRICEDTSDRIPKFVLPGVRDQLAASRPVAVCAAVVAGWARYAEGTDENGDAIDVRDPRREQLMTAAGLNRENPTAFLDVTEIFGDLGATEAFAGPYRSALSTLHTAGTRALLDSLTTAD